jgi:hypothetical protein
MYLSRLYSAPSKDAASNLGSVPPRLFKVIVGLYLVAWEDLQLRWHPPSEDASRGQAAHDSEAGEESKSFCGDQHLSNLEDSTLVSAVPLLSVPANMVPFIERNHDH